MGVVGGLRVKGKRYATWGGMWKRERVSEKRGTGEKEGCTVSTAQGKHKKGGK